MLQLKDDDEKGMQTLEASLPSLLDIPGMYLRTYVRTYVCMCVYVYGIVGVSRHITFLLNCHDHALMRTTLCVYACVRSCTCMYTYMCMHSRMCMRVCMLVLMPVPIFMHIHVTYMFVNMLIFMLMHVHVHPMQG